MIIKTSYMEYVSVLEKQINKICCRKHRQY